MQRDWQLHIFLSGYFLQKTQKITVMLGAQVFLLFFYYTVDSWGISFIHLTLLPSPTHLLYIFMVNGSQTHLDLLPRPAKCHKSHAAWRFVLPRLLFLPCLYSIHSLLYFQSEVEKRQPKTSKIVVKTNAWKSSMTFNPALCCCLPSVLFVSCLSLTDMSHHFKACKHSVLLICCLFCLGLQIFFGRSRVHKFQKGITISYSTVHT